MMEDYEIETIKQIKQYSQKLSTMPDEKIHQLYSEWSNLLCAGWLSPSENGVKEFCKWATTAPCDY